jgi:hypothetical protein
VHREGRDAFVKRKETKAWGVSGEEEEETIERKNEVESLIQEQRLILDRPTCGLQLPGQRERLFFCL